MFLRSHSGYFDLTSDLRANLHLWSLAIEEQFYFFWPFFITFLRPDTSRRVVAFLFGASLIYGIVSLYYWPEDSFYLLWARLWELAAGGILALHSSDLTFARFRSGLQKFNLTPECSFTLRTRARSLRLVRVQPRDALSGLARTRASDRSMALDLRGPRRNDQPSHSIQENFRQDWSDQLSALPLALGPALFR